MKTIKLTPNQRSLLCMDVVDVGADPKANEKDHSEEMLLIGELRSGNIVSVTDFFIKCAVEFADRDADPDEQRVYRNLKRKITSAVIELSREPQP